MKPSLSQVNTLKKLLKDLNENFDSNIPTGRNVGLEDFRRLQGQQDVILYIRNLIEGDDDDRPSLELDE
jgi:hypothetical protein